MCLRSGPGASGAPGSSRLSTHRYPALEPHIEDLLPKKGDTIVCKCKDYIQLVLDPEGEFIFFQCRRPEWGGRTDLPRAEETRKRWIRGD